METSLKGNSAKKAPMRGRRKSWPQATGNVVPRSCQNSAYKKITFSEGKKNGSHNGTATGK